MRSETDLRPEPEQLGVEGDLLWQTVVLELQEESLPPEDVAVHSRRLAGQVPVVHFERLGDLAAQAGGPGDQALRVPGQDFVVDPGLVVVALEVRVSDQAAEVLVALPVLGQQHEVEGLAVGLAFLVAHAPPGDIRLDADDRLHALGRDGLDEGDRAVQGAVVRDGHGVEAELRTLFGEIVDAAQPIEQAELGVEVQVDEIVRRDGHGG